MALLEATEVVNNQDNIVVNRTAAHAKPLLQESVRNRISKIMCLLFSKLYGK